MFRSEARIASMMTHPNIVTTIDFDKDDDGALLLAMEFVDGTDLKKLAVKAHAAGQPLPPGLIAFAAGEVLRALEYAHNLDDPDGGKPLGIVHRDVSPHNVLVSRSGAVKLADFGIAKATAASTHSGSVKGKVAYMAPEQAAGQPLDGRADLFAVGVMLYELASGARPFEGSTDKEVLSRLLSGQVKPVRERAKDMPKDLAAVTMRLLAHDRNARFPSAAEALRALVACACYPDDGATELAKTVRDVLDRKVDTAALGTAPTLASTKGTKVVRLSRPVLYGLIVAAVISLGAAIAVWLIK
jgi:serine/threonine-protein kinase